MASEGGRRPSINPLTHDTHTYMYIKNTQGENGIAVKLGTEGNVALTKATEEVGEPATDCVF